MNQPKLTLPLEVGKKYVRRDGEVVTITHPISSSSNYVWCAGKCTYTRMGNFFSAGEESILDLIADYIEPVKPNAHPHAANMMLYAQDAAETDEPWVRWQTCRIGRDEWINLDGPAHWGLQHAYRRKPKTIRIGGHDIHPDDLLAAREQIEAVFKRCSV